MGRPLSRAIIQQRKEDEEAAQDRRYEKTRQRKKKEREEEEEIQAKRLSNNQYKVNSYDLFKEVLFSFHKTNLIEKPSLANLKFTSNINKPKSPINTAFNTTKYQNNQSLIAKKNRLKKWSEDSYDDWCKKEGISSSLLSNIFNNNEDKFEAFLEKKKQQILDIDAELKKQQLQHNEDQNIKKLKSEETNLLSLIEYEKGIKNYHRLKALESLQTINKKNKVTLWTERLKNGDIDAMNDVADMIFPISFKDDEYLEQFIEKKKLPSEVTIGSKIVNSENIEIVIYLSKDLNFLPRYKPSLQNNKLQEVQIRPEEEVQATQQIICGLTITYLHRVFNTMTSLNNIKLEVNVKSPHPATGHDTDFVLLYININRNDFEQCDIQRIDPTRFILDQESNNRIEKEFNHRPQENPMIKERIEKRSIRLVDKKNKAFCEKTIGKDIYDYFVHSSMQS